LIFLLEGAASIPPGEGKPADWLRLLELMDLPRHKMFEFRRAVRGGKWRTQRDPRVYLRRSLLKGVFKIPRSALRPSKAAELVFQPTSEVEALINESSDDSYDEKAWETTDRLLENVPAQFHSDEQPFSLDKLAFVHGLNEWDIKVIRCKFDRPTVGRETALSRLKVESDRKALQAAWKRWDRGSTMGRIKSAMQGGGPKRTYEPI
jgi:hypothetical protein